MTIRKKLTFAVFCSLSFQTNITVRCLNGKGSIGKQLWEEKHKLPKMNFISAGKVQLGYAPLNIPKTYEFLNGNGNFSQLKDKGWNCFLLD